MIWKKAFKYPVLIIGIILFGLYIFDPKTKEFWRKYNRRFIPSTCDALVSRSASKADTTWSFDCPGIQLLVVKIPYESQPNEKYPVTRVNMYKLLANSLVNLSKITNPETMENLQLLKVIVENPRLNILAKTDGEAIVGFLKFKTQEDIAAHLKLTVKTQEFK